MNAELTHLKGIESKIYLIRGEKVMLDEDLAILYGVPTMRLNEQVKRNIRRFPTDFMFQLTDQEYAILISQIAISKKGRGGRRKAPFAFTEQGIAMLSAVLHSDRAIDANIEIMRAFVRIRHILSSHRELERKIHALENKYDQSFKMVFDAIKNLMSPALVPTKRIIGIRGNNK
jgi:hypothetical protein